MIFIISDISKSLGLEWVLYKLKNKFKINVILINCRETSFENWLKKNQINSFSLTYQNKYLDFIPTILKILFILIRLKPKVVHCHLRKASLLGLIASSLLFVKKRIYTRHHGSESEHIFSEYLIDKLIFLMSTHILVISEITKNLTISNTPSSKNKIKKIYHGFNFDYFNSLNQIKINLLRKKYNINENIFVVGAISRLVDWKNVDKIIESFVLFNSKYNNSLLILANTKFNTKYSLKIKQKLNLIPKKNYRIIEFEEDLKHLYKIFDIFIHIPKLGDKEAFGQTFIESLLLKIPCIFSDTGVAKEFTNHLKNSYICNPNNKYSIFRGMEYLKNNKFKNKFIINNGYRFVKLNFGLKEHLQKLYKIYKS
ncbi:glycosyltransferase family 4 protein [Candidatus Pelagibacter sp.]|jgi:glycosyltransferase involved in cell wall biosynthesis|nr:glycosyltransferase family 4 protein [Candidatus Pelagibacter sp.]